MGAYMGLDCVRINDRIRECETGNIFVVDMVVKFSENCKPAIIGRQIGRRTGKPRDIKRKIVDWEYAPYERKYDPLINQQVENHNDSIMAMAF